MSFKTHGQALHEIFANYGVRGKVAYPRPPTSGAVGYLPIMSSRSWHDWWEALTPAQQHQYIRDNAKWSHHYVLQKKEG